MEKGIFSYKWTKASSIHIFGSIALEEGKALYRKNQRKYSIENSVFLEKNNKIYI